MERKDLIRVNGPIFTNTGKAIQAAAAQDVRVVVIGNPCNTNCLIAMHNAPKIPKERWFAMTRLDQNRAATQLAEGGRRSRGRQERGHLGQPLGHAIPRLLSCDDQRPTGDRRDQRRGLAQRAVRRRRAEARCSRDQGPRGLQCRLGGERHP